MEAAGYTIDLYCDDPRHNTLVPFKTTSLDASYYGQTYAECKKEARKDGWKWLDGKNICPVCSRSK